MFYFRFVRCIAVSILALCIISSVLFGQKLRQKNDIKIKCALAEIVKDNADLNLRLVIINLGHSSQVVYKDFLEGGFNDFYVNNRSNFKLIIQRKDLAKYQPYFNKASVDAAPGMDTLDHLKKKTLASNDSLVSSFHIDDLYKFDPGFYRLKCLYWNDIHVNKSIETNCVYFRVEKTIYIKHYFNEPKADSVGR